MSTPIAYGLEAIPQTSTKSAGWLKRAYDRLLAARERQATMYVVNYLAALTDNRLAEMGYTAEQIRAIRVDRKLPQLAD